MKNIWIYVLLLMSLAACAGANNGGCSSDGEVCVKVRAGEPIQYMEPIDIVITVTSRLDISQLGISLIIWPDTMIVGEAQGLEPGIEVWKGDSGVTWRVDIKAGDVITLSRKVYLPVEAGVYEITVHASTPQLRVIDEISIYQTGDEVKVYLSGTEIPFTPGPLPTMNPIELQTLQAIAHLDSFAYAYPLSDENKHPHFPGLPAASFAYF